MQDRIQAMQVFVRVAELQSFTRAGLELQLSKTYVSTLVQQLENQLGSRLLQRTTRSVQLTQDGQLYYQRCKDLLAEFDELQQLFATQNRDVAGRLRIDLPAVAATSMLLPRLPQFLALYPKVQLELSCTDRKVDLIAEGFDCVLRVGSIDAEGLIARPLPAMPLLNLASPAYLEKYGLPQQPADLTGHQLVHYRPHFTGRDSYFEYLEHGVLQKIQLSGALTVNNTEAYIAACVAGLGIIQAPAGGVTTLLQTGQLQQILPLYQAPAMQVSLLYPHRRHVPVRLRLFMQWLESEFSHYLAEAVPSSC
jgi:DNA-binding transcriptional LysR family regulator